MHAGLAPALGAPLGWHSEVRDLELLGLRLGDQIGAPRSAMDHQVSAVEGRPDGGRVGPLAAARDDDYALRILRPKRDQG